MATPCATCTHDEAVHSDLVGCTANDDHTYCTCPQFAAPAKSGRALRDEGIAQIDSADGDAEAEWRNQARIALDALILTDTEFHADDLIEMIGSPPRPNMVGALFMAASRQNRINAVGFHQSTRPSCHARVQRTWRAA
jgi:hypothetical protein